MKKLLATLNIGGTYTPDNVRRSMLAACSRWDCQYMEVVSVRDKNPFMSRLSIWDYLPLDYDRILFMDSDMLIREDCPSPFALVNPSHIGVIQNYQGDTHSGDPEKYHLPDFDKLKAWMCPEVKYDPNTFFNGGFILVNPSIHVQTWKWACDSVRSMAEHRSAKTGQPFGLSPTEEQAALNIAFVSAFVPMTYLPHSFNRMGPTVWQGDAMEAYVYHFAGDMCNGSGETKRGRMESVLWRTSAEVLP